MGTERHRSIPIETQFFVVASSGLDVARVQSFSVDARNRAALRFGVNVIRIGRIGKRVESIASKNAFPLRNADAAEILRAPDPVRIVLQSAINLIRISIGSSEYPGGVSITQWESIL